MADLITYHGDSKVIGRICELLNSMTGVSFRKVQTLPQTGESNVIYLVPKSTSETDNVFDEYIWIDNDWELIGDTEIDLSNYYTKTETDGLIQALDVTEANVSASKTIKKWSETDGKVSITTQDISITKSQVSDFPTIPDELSDLQDDSTHRLVTDTEKTTWNGKSDTDENVKQVYTQTTSGDYLLLASNSNKDSTSDETEKVKKIAHAYITGSTGNVVFCRKHTYTSVQNHILAIGNAIIDGVEGAVDGVLRLFGKGAYYSQFYDGFNSLTANQTYRPRDLTGTMALLPDIADSCIQVENGEYNFINPPYYHANGTNSSGITYSTNENTGEYTVKGTASSAFNANIKRWLQGLYLKTGKYKLSGLPSNTGCQLRVYSSTSSGTTTLIGSDTGSGFEFSLTERTLMHIALVIPTNTVVDFTFRPKLEKLSDWVDLGSQAKRTDITLTEQYSELMFEINYLGNGYINKIHILRVELSSTPLFFESFTYGTNNFGVIAWLDGNSIKFQYDSTNASDIVKLYAKA